VDETGDGVEIGRRRPGEQQGGVARLPACRVTALAAGDQDLLDGGERRGAVGVRRAALTGARVDGGGGGTAGEIGAPQGQRDQRADDGPGETLRSHSSPAGGG